MFLRLMKLTPPATTEKSTLAGCELVKRGRPVNGRSGGGVCMYLRSNINYRIRNDLCENFECIIVEVTNHHSKPYLIRTWYRPSKSHSAVYDASEISINKIDAEDKEPYLLGDLNSDLSPNDTKNYNCDALKGFLISLMFTVWTSL